MVSPNPAESSPLTIILVGFSPEKEAEFKEPPEERLQKAFGIPEKMARHFVKTAPVVVKRGATKKEAKAYVQTLHKIGATVKVQIDTLAETSKPQPPEPTPEAPQVAPETPQRAPEAPVAQPAPEASSPQEESTEGNPTPPARPRHSAFKDVNQPGLTSTGRISIGKITTKARVPKNKTQEIQMPSRPSQAARESAMARARAAEVDASSVKKTMMGFPTAPLEENEAPQEPTSQEPRPIQVLETPLEEPAPHPVQLLGDPIEEPPLAPDPAAEDPSLFDPEPLSLLAEASHDPASGLWNGPNPGDEDFDAAEVFGESATFGGAPLTADESILDLEEIAKPLAPLPTHDAEPAIELHSPDPWPDMLEDALSEDLDGFSIEAPGDMPVQDKSFRRSDGREGVDPNMLSHLGMFEAGESSLGDIDLADSRLPLETFGTADDYGNPIDFDAPAAPSGVYDDHNETFGDDYADDDYYNDYEDDYQAYGDYGEDDDYDDPKPDAESPIALLDESPASAHDPFDLEGLGKDDSFAATDDPNWAQKDPFSLAADSVVARLPLADEPPPAHDPFAGLDPVRSLDAGNDPFGQLNEALPSLREDSPFGSSPKSARPASPEDASLDNLDPEDDFIPDEDEFQPDRPDMLPSSTTFGGSPPPSAVPSPDRAAKDMYTPPSRSNYRPSVVTSSYTALTPGDDLSFWQSIPTALTAPFSGAGILWLPILGAVSFLSSFVLSLASLCSLPVGLFLFFVHMGLMGTYFVQSISQGSAKDASAPSLPSLDFDTIKGDIALRGLILTILAALLFAVPAALAPDDDGGNADMDPNAATRVWIPDDEYFDEDGETVDIVPNGEAKIAFSERGDKVLVDPKRRTVHVMEGAERYSQKEEDVPYAELAVFLAALLVPLLYWPMALAVAGMSSSLLNMFNPFVVLKAIFKGGTRYLFIAALGAFLITVSVGVTILLTLGAAASGMGAFAALISILPLSLHGYVTGVQGHLMGRMMAETPEDFEEFGI